MSHTTRSLTLVLFFLPALILPWPGAVFAQDEEPTVEPSEEPTPVETVEEKVEGDDGGLDGFTGGELCITGCCPPSTQQKVMVGVGTLFLGVVFGFLFVGLMTRRFIAQDRDPLMGRHAGYSLTLLLTSGALAGLTKLVTGCFHSETIIWLIFVGCVWALHGLYTLIVVRSQ